MAWCLARVVPRPTCISTYLNLLVLLGRQIHCASVKVCFFFAFQPSGGRGARRSALRTECCPAARWQQEEQNHRDDDERRLLGTPESRTGVLLFRKISYSQTDRYSTKVTSRVDIPIGHLRDLIVTINFWWAKKYELLSCSQDQGPKVGSFWYIFPATDWACGENRHWISLKPNS